MVIKVDTMVIEGAIVKTRDLLEKWVLLDYGLDVRTK